MIINENEKRLFFGCEYETLLVSLFQQETLALSALIFNPGGV